MALKTLSLLRRVNRGVAIVAGMLLLLCAALVLVDIVLRQLGASFGGTDEITGYVMAIVSAWGMGLTMLELAHVRIDVLRSRAGDLGRCILDLGSPCSCCPSPSPSLPCVVGRWSRHRS